MSEVTRLIIVRSNSTLLHTNKTVIITEERWWQNYFVKLLYFSESKYNKWKNF